MQVRAGRRMTASTPSKLMRGWLEMDRPKCQPDGSNCPECQGGYRRWEVMCFVYGFRQPGPRLCSSLTEVAEAIRPLNPRPPGPPRRWKARGNQASQPTSSWTTTEVEGHQPPGTQVALTPTLNLLLLATSLAYSSIEGFVFPNRANSSTGVTSASKAPTVPQNVLARTRPQPRSSTSVPSYEGYIVRQHLCLDLL